MTLLRITFIFILSIVGSTALPCSLLSPGMDRPDPSEFVFSGRIIQIEGPVPGDTSLKAAVAVVQAEQVFSGNLEPGPVRVAVYYLTPDCRARPADSGALASSFPVGSQVEVIAQREIDDSNILRVTVGADREFATAGRAPSSPFAARQVLAALSMESTESARVAILQDMIPKLPVFFDFEATVNHFITSEPQRTELLETYRAYQPRQ